LFYFLELRKKKHETNMFITRQECNTKDNVSLKAYIFV